MLASLFTVLFVGLLSLYVSESSSKIVPSFQFHRKDRTLCTPPIDRRRRWTWKRVGGVNNVAHLKERRCGTPLTQVRFPSAASDFSPSELSVQALLPMSVQPPCTAACSNICANVKDPVVHIRVRWFIETLKHPACTVGWVARLCRSWLSLGKATGISHGRISNGTIQL